MNYTTCGVWCVDRPDFRCVAGHCTLDCQKYCGGACIEVWKERQLAELKGKKP